MADPDHLAILRQGIAAWNQWRQAHPDIQPDLTRAQLRRADLRGAWLIDVRLTGAYCFGADFRNADLTGAVLIGTDLGAADLRGANLSFANLSGADLTDGCLWQTRCEDWLIQGITCNAIFWDKERQERTTYDLGEFERLFSNSDELMDC